MRTGRGRGSLATRERDGGGTNREDQEDEAGDYKGMLGPDQGTYSQLQLGPVALI